LCGFVSFVVRTINNDHYLQTNKKENIKIALMVQRSEGKRIC